jgi:hypothetical protein
LIDCAPAKIAITPTWGLIGDHPDIATTHVRGSVRLLNTKHSISEIMELLEPLAARDRGGLWFTLAIWRSDYPKASSPILRRTLERQNPTLLRGVRCVGSAVLSSYVSGEKFSTSSSMWTECIRVPMTDGKLRVG